MSTKVVDRLDQEREETLREMRLSALALGDEARESALGIVALVARRPAIALGIAAVAGVMVGALLRTGVSKSVGKGVARASAFAGGFAARQAVKMLRPR